jgi:hypothetical protein
MGSTEKEKLSCMCTLLKYKDSKIKTTRVKMCMLGETDGTKDHGAYGHIFTLSESLLCI